MTKIITSNSKNITTRITETLPRLVSSFSDGDNTHFSSTFVVNPDDSLTDTRLYLEFMFFYDEVADDLYLDDILLSWDIIPENIYSVLPKLRTKLKYLFGSELYNETEVPISEFSSDRFINSILTLMASVEIIDSKYETKIKVKNKEKLFEDYGTGK